MDSDEDGDNDRVISLTHLLFGNIDDDGQLENDFLDPESIRHLDQLRQLGIGTQLKEITDDVDSPDLDQRDCNEHEEITVKSPSAIDYSDITELADETDEMDVDKAGAPSESVKTKEEENNFDAKKGIEESDDAKPTDSDLMPPPALPPPKDCNENLNDSNTSVSMYTNSEVKSKEQDNTVLKASRVETFTHAEKKLDTPLAAMLPSKYRNMDVTKLFPEFRHGQVLRFSRLFGPGKPTSLPQIWRGVKKKKKKKTGEEREKETTNVHKVLKGLTLDIPLSPPPPEECESDDEMKLLKPEEKNRMGTKNESYKSNELSPGFAAWRYGPSVLWYDMLNVAESGEGFDYGFRLKEERCPEPIVRKENYRYESVQSSLKGIGKGTPIRVAAKQYSLSFETLSRWLTKLPAHKGSGSVAIKVKILCGPRLKQN